MVVLLETSGKWYDIIKRIFPKDMTCRELLKNTHILLKNLLRVNDVAATGAKSLNDIDLCMRIRDKGHLICWTPHAELYHHESISRGSDETIQNMKRFHGEISRFKERYYGILEKGDTYYNPNLTLIHENFSVVEN